MWQIDVIEVDGAYYGAFSILFLISFMSYVSWKRMMMIYKSFLVVGFSGCHRYEAHQKLGLPTIRCKIRKGTKETLRYVMYVCMYICVQRIASLLTLKLISFHRHHLRWEYSLYFMKCVRVGICVFVCIKEFK